MTTDPTVSRPEVDDPRVLALAQARQQLAYENPFNAVCPPWDGLTKQEQHLSLLDARSYLHAALRAGLVPAAVSVPPPATRADDRADRVAVLAEVADWLKAWRPEFFERWAIAEQERYEGGVDDAATALRRMADEAQPARLDRCPHGCDTSTCPCLACEADDEQQSGGPCVAGEQQNETPEARRCVCPHPADEHSVYGCVDGCGCEWMPKRAAKGA